MNHIIGIDLGTTNSCAAYFDNGKVNVIPNSSGNRVTSSIISFDNKNAVLVGEQAKNLFISNPQNTITNIKRKMGSKEEITIGDKRYFPETLSSFILSKIKKDAEIFLNEKIKDVV
ncbi:MAG TPA: Hsp70 family protein, partial [Spirochaetota bacterium]|nr:Hsp70 family protein [Spirochaetota bacterium]